MSDAPRSRGRGRGQNRGKALRARGRRGLRQADWRTPNPGQAEDEEEEDEEEREERETWERQWRGREVREQGGKLVDAPAGAGSLKAGSAAAVAGREKAEGAEEEEGEEEEEEEPEVDLTAFLARQRLSPTSPLTSLAPTEEEGVDHSLSHIPSSSARPEGKGKKGMIEWSEDLEELKREKEKAEALWELKARFKGSSSTTTAAGGAAGGRADGGKRGIVRSMAAGNGRTSSGKGRGAGRAGDAGGSERDGEAFLDDLLG